MFGCVKAKTRREPQKKTPLRATRQLGCKTKPPYACQLTHPLLLKKSTAHSEEDSMLVELTPLHSNGSSSSSSARPPAPSACRCVECTSLGIFIWHLATKYCSLRANSFRLIDSRGVLVALLLASTTSKELATSVMSKVRCSVRCASEPLLRLLLLLLCSVAVSYDGKSALATSGIDVN